MSLDSLLLLPLPLLSVSLSLSCIDIRHSIHHTHLPCFLLHTTLPLLSLQTITTNHNKTERAVCGMKWNTRFAHFPHLMQQLFSCYQFWLAFPESTPKYLIMPQWVPTVGYSPMMIRALSDKFNLTVQRLGRDNVLGESNVTVHKIDKIPKDTVWVKPAPAVFRFAGKYTGGYTMLYDHKPYLRDFLLDADKRRSCPSPTRPRIGILNRGKSRRIANAHTVLEGALRKHFPNATVDITYFEGKSFWYQLEWYAKQDVVFTPHGANGLNMLFMPECSAFLELFPDQYADPNFFATMAKAHRIKYGYLYPYPSGEPQNPFAKGTGTGDRKAIRSRNMTPPIESVLVAVDEHLHHHRRCCASRLRLQGEAEDER